MKLLLTSGGVTNDSIRAALVRLLGKSVAESSALIVPTAQWGHPMCSPATVWKTIADTWEFGTGLAGLGWKSIGVLELTALPTIGAERWMPWVQAADVLLVDGGEATYLAYWIRQSGLADLLPALDDTVWVGVSAGSMVLTPRIGSQFVEWAQADSDQALGVVDFSIFPHLDVFPDNSLANARRWATELGGPAYVIDDQPASAVAAGKIDVISEGRWELLNSEAVRP
jgi:dipeptidase E